ncbi:MAG: AAA family ATPase [Myxococcaceae bacterium]
MTRLSAITLEGYRCFRDVTRIDLARLTVIIGKNNSGKSALCFSPAFFTRAFTDESELPFPSQWNGIDFGPLQTVITDRRATGLGCRLDFTNSVQLAIGATVLPERGYAQHITAFSINDKRLTGSWEELRAERKNFNLTFLENFVRIVRGVRPLQPRRFPLEPRLPRTVGPLGADAAHMFRAASDLKKLELNKWFSGIGVQLTTKETGDDFEILVQTPTGSPVNWNDAGAGISHILPVAAELVLPSQQRGLLCIEQPELHLHPFAHLHIGELFIQALETHPELSVLVETHSDAFLMRLRKAVAAGRLSPQDISVLYVDNSSGRTTIQSITINKRGMLSSWPKGVFAETQAEFFALRREAQQ